MMTRTPNPDESCRPDTGEDAPDIGQQVTHPAIERMPGRRTLLIGLGLALLLPIGSETMFYLHSTSDRCFLDRIPIQPVYRVTVTLESGRSLAFGSPRCTLTYLERNPATGKVDVVLTDEVTGRPLPARKAFLVKSKVETSRQDHNHIHVFADEVEARRHALLYEGRLLDAIFAPYLRDEMTLDLPKEPR